MKLLNFNIIKLTLCLVIGIILAHYFELDGKLVLFVTIALIATLGIYWFLLREKIDRHPYFSILVFFCTIGVGMFAYKIQDDTLKSHHYSNLTTSITTSHSLTFRVEERLKPDAYNQKYIVSIIAFNKQKASGKLLINIQHDSLTKPLSIDDEIFTVSQLQEIQKPLNPHQFDYSKYLELKQVYHQLYLKQDSFLLLSESKHTIYGFADKLRTIINTKLTEAGFKKDVLSIINALLLGQRQSIDKSIYNNYVNSGTIHILAVSGLHVGILLWILNFLFKPLLYFKYGNYLRPLIIVILLWSFAIVAGLSPSVTRAVTMFSVISIAMHYKRPTNIYNTLVISAFLILLVKPTFLFEVGFQLSYLAVIGIVSIQPILYKLWKPKYVIIDKLWQIFTVTLAAQFGVVPISLFYFHQFPGLFFISNLVVIPFLGLILGFGLLVIALALIDLLPKLLVEFYTLIIDSLNEFIAWVAKFEDFLFRDIPFTLLQVIFAYFIISTLVQIYKFKNFKWIAICLLSIIGYQGILILNNYSAQDNAFIIFNKSRFSIIGQKNGDQLVIHHNLDSIKATTDNVISNYKVGETINTITADSLRSIYQYKNETLLVIDSLGIYKSLSFKPELILLCNSPKVNLNRIIDSLQPQQIIVDASNYKSYANRWKATCLDKKIPFHYTNEKGAFILK